MTAESALVKVHKQDMEEAVKAVKAVAAQVKMSLGESDDSIAMLVESISATVTSVRNIESQLNSLESAQPGEELMSVFEQSCKTAQVQLSQAFMALQFYDRLSQRLQHVEDNLIAVIDVMQSPDQQHGKLWEHLNSKLRSVYSREQEQHITGSAAAEGVGASAQKPGSSAADESDIELF